MMRPLCVKALVLLLFTHIILCVGHYTNSFIIAPAPNPANWVSCAVSSSGQYIVAVIYDNAGVQSNGIYTSSDYGYKWTGTQMNLAWSAVASDSTGQYLLAVVFGGSVYISSNYGSTFASMSEVLSFATAEWKAAASDGSGQHLFIASSDTAAVCYSHDGGTSWNQSVGVPSTAQWYDLTCDSTGRYVAGVVYGGYVYTSQNYGVSFTPQSNVSLWTSIASDFSGQFLLASQYGFLYTSSNYGVDFTAMTTTVLKWQSVSVSSNFQYQAAVVDGGGVYLSSNAGATWQLSLAPSDLAWSLVCSSGSGQYVTAGVDGGGLFISNYVPSSQPTSQPSRRPSLQPTSQPTDQPTAPTICPSSVPSSQPSSVPTRRPSAQPQAAPTGVPSMTPSYHPTSQPSTYPTQHILNLTHVMVSKSYQPTSTYTSYTFDNIGDQRTSNGAVYLTAQILQSAFYQSSGAYLNITAGSSDGQGGSRIVIVNADCAPVDSCGGILCAVNADVSAAISTIEGGSLTVTAQVVGGQEASHHLEICSEDLVGYIYKIYFSVTAYSLPTPNPTVAPTVSSDSGTKTGNIVLRASPSTPFYVIAACSLVYAMLGVYITRKRDKNVAVTQIHLKTTCMHMAVSGYHISSEVFYMTVLFASRQLLLHKLAVLLLCSRLCTLFPTGYFLLRTFGPVRFSSFYSEKLDKDHLFYNASIYSAVIFLMLLDQSLVCYLPWYSTAFSNLSRGFPDNHFYQVYMIPKLMQLSVSLIIQIVVINVSNSFNQHGKITVSFAVVLLYLVSSLVAFTVFLATSLIRLGVKTSTDGRNDKREVKNPMVRDSNSNSLAFRPDSAVFGTEMVPVQVRTALSTRPLPAVPTPTLEQVAYLELRETSLTNEVSELKSKVSTLEAMMNRLLQRDVSAAHRVNGTAIDVDVDVDVEADCES